MVSPRSRIFACREKWLLTAPLPTPPSGSKPSPWPRHAASSNNFKTLPRIFCKLFSPNLLPGLWMGDRKRTICRPDPSAKLAPGRTWRSTLSTVWKRFIFQVRFSINFPRQVFYRLLFRSLWKCCTPEVSGNIWSTPAVPGCEVGQRNTEWTWRQYSYIFNKMIS